MTTTVRIHVNGRYQALVRKNDDTPAVVHGNYEGSPNPMGEYTLYLPHGVETVLRIDESPVPEAPPAPAEESKGESALEVKK